jgi:hypothetical protein
VEVLLAKFSKLVLVLAIACSDLYAQEQHDHGMPQKLGKVSFPISCSPSVQMEFNRGIALLHSFAYTAANETFQHIATEDSACAMAHWGVAMSLFHQLWEPPLAPRALPTAQKEIEIAQRVGSTDAREKGYIRAFSLLVKDADTAPFKSRDQQYEQAMAELAQQNPNDIEVQVFYALSLISNAPLTDKSHARDKHALAILEPLDRAYPDHPGITHYIIHASDSGELAGRGLPAARKYAQIAPSAPHALHMPSHIFTRLGLWRDSITSNLAASRAAREQNDIGEELHSMDYLVYAYLQLGEYENAHQVIEKLRSMPNLGVGDFKVGYSATAMPVRFAVEQQKWEDAAKIEPLAGSPPHVAAIAAWAHALGTARGDHPSDISANIAALDLYEKQLRDSGNEYWATQTAILRKEARAWGVLANGNPAEAETLLRAAADAEDAMEKSPATPGPIVPAREQLGDFLLLQHRPAEAIDAFKVSLVNAPSRKGPLDGIAQANRQLSAQ